MIGKRKSLEGILSSFTKAINDLDSLVSQNTAEIAANDAVVQKLNLASAKLQGEADDASAVRKKISDLVTA